MADLLTGIRVLDFGRYIAGPFCSALLADLGAEVIRVEKVGGGEDRFLMPVTSGGDGGFYLQVNRGKRAITLDVNCREGQVVLQRLVATTDVVVANLPDAALKKLRLDYASLSAVKPDVILTSVSAFGAGGPSSHKLGFDAIGQAMSGVMYLSGRPGEPTKAYSPYVDFSTALVATIGTLAALLARFQSGQGQEVKASLLATALTIANGALIEQSMLATNRVPSRNRSQTQGPSDAYETQDGWIIVQCIGQPLFERWTVLMGETHWLEDSRFTDDKARGIHGEVLSERMARWCAERTTEQALRSLEDVRIPAGPVLSPQQALDDAHIKATEFLKVFSFPGSTCDVPVADTPFSLSVTPARVRSRAPLLGEHTDIILGELGFSGSAIGELRDRGVV